MTKMTCAIIGASANRKKFGNISLRAHQQSGYEVFAVNPRGGEAEGLPVYPSITDVPGDAPLSRVSMYVSPSVGLTLLDDIARRGCEELWLNPGAESDELVAAAERLGLSVVEGCSIVDLGVSPHQFLSH